jgi:hypothetical protein
VFDYTVVEYGGLGTSQGNIRTFCSSSALPVVSLSNTNLDNSGGYGLYVQGNCPLVIGDNVTFMNNAEGDSNISLE